MGRISDAGREVENVLLQRLALAFDHKDRGHAADHITKDDVEALSFNGSASNANCALRTLRRMLHKAEEWNLIARVPKFKLLREHGRRLRLDDDAEQKLLAAAKASNWRRGSFELFRDIIILARNTGMRNRRELYRVRRENLDLENRIIFVPDSKTDDGRRMIPMSDRVYEVLRVRAGGKCEGWLFPSKHSKCGHLTDLAKQFRLARAKAGLPEELVLYCSRHDYDTRVLTTTGNLAAVMKIHKSRWTNEQMHAIEQQNFELFAFGDRLHNT